MLEDDMGAAGRRLLGCCRFTAGVLHAACGCSGEGHAERSERRKKEEKSGSHVWWKNEWVSLLRVKIREMVGAWSRWTRKAARSALIGWFTRRLASARNQSGNFKRFPIYILCTVANISPLEIPF